MISPELRFNYVGSLCHIDPTDCEIIDYDRRRWISVTGSQKHFLDEEAPVRMAQRHADNLDSQVVAFLVSDDGLLLDVCSRIEYDPTPAPIYPQYPGKLREADTLTRSQLVEDDRLAPSVDLVHYISGGKTTQAVFKYSMTRQRQTMTWKDLHITKALTDHPSTLTFDRIVLDEVESRVVGFTTLFVPGGDLNANTTIPFRFSWLQQLTTVVDEVNLRYGIMHQDITPRNLLVDDKGNLKLFDFNIASKINKFHFTEKYNCTLNDVNGVIFAIYELLTFDGQFRTNCETCKDVSLVESLAHWPVKRPLQEGTDVAACREFLAKWVADRRTTRMIQDHSEATEPLEWPELPEPEPSKWLCGFNESGQPEYEFSVPRQGRFLALQDGRYVIPWERRAQNTIDLQKAQDQQKAVADRVQSEEEFKEE